MYFKKIKENFTFNSYTENSCKRFYGVNGKGIGYYDLDDRNNHLFNLIKRPYRNHFFMNLMKINSNRIMPHTDSDIQVTINFYIQADNCRTVFYEPTEHCKTDKLPGQTNGNIFDPQYLIEKDSFIAENNEIWILDVTRPHSVERLSDNYSERIALCLQTNKFSFNETLKMLK
jgi:hypothetical protein